MCVLAIALKRTDSPPFHMLKALLKWDNSLTWLYSARLRFVELRRFESSGQSSGQLFSIQLGLRLEARCEVRRACLNVGVQVGEAGGCNTGGEIAFM